jgi:amidase
MHVQNDAPFCGVPFLLKDAHHALRGHTMSSGSALLKDFRPENDAEIVRRFKKAGLVILGKTNTPEFRTTIITEPRAFGPTRNPWSLAHGSGGSSGGSAAAVAARIVPLASATDEGGSIRVPASYCGLFGLKPSRGRNPVGPDFGLEWDGMSTSHVLTRSVRDSAAMLDAVSGSEPGAPYGIIAPERPFLEEIRHDPRRLRIGFHARSAYGRDVHPECVRAVAETCELLEDLGHDVEGTVPNYREEEAALNWTIILIGNVAAQIDRLVQVHGLSRVRRELELQNCAMYSVGKHLKALQFIRAKRRWRDFGIIMDQMSGKYDMLLTPTLGEPPIPVGSRQPSKSDERSMRLISSWVGRPILSSQKLTLAIVEQIVHNSMKAQMPFAVIANITGQPAMSVPLHWAGSGLPCGVQFIGRLGEEARLLRLGAQLERARPWADRKPQILQ